MCCAGLGNVQVIARLYPFSDSTFVHFVNYSILVKYLIILISRWMSRLAEFFDDVAPVAMNWCLLETAQLVGGILSPAFDK